VSARSAPRKKAVGPRIDDRRLLLRDRVGHDDPAIGGIGKLQFPLHQHGGGDFAISAESEPLGRRRKSDHEDNQHARHDERGSRHLHARRAWACARFRFEVNGAGHAPAVCGTVRVSCATSRTALRCTVSPYAVAPTSPLPVCRYRTTRKTDTAMTRNWSGASTP